MQMGLYDQPFEAIKSGEKTIEVRLNDEKRSQLQIDDFIEFKNLTTGETLKVKVLGLEKFATFKELFAKYSGSIIGAPEDESIEELDRENQEIYSREREQKYGALAIKIERITNS